MTKLSNFYIVLSELSCSLAQIVMATRSGLRNTPGCYTHLFEFDHVGGVVAQPPRAVHLCPAIATDYCFLICLATNVYKPDL